MNKRFIEDVLPLGELNKTARKRSGGGGIGSLNAMHPYFARRPLTASRAMTLESILGAREDLEQRASRWAETHRREKEPEVKQLELWGEGESDEQA